VPEDQAAALLADVVARGEHKIEKWNEEVEQWIERVNFLAATFQEWELPPITEADRRTLIEHVCLGATNLRALDERPVWPVVKSWLTPAQQSLVDLHAPERLELPNGRRAKITYEHKKKPTLAARIQDLYGVETDLRIAQNRVPLTIEVLAPNFRPVQVTTSLANFWKQSYPKLKQELQRKYPKHQWR
jgi:ATP-dependent helicase HrpB